MEVEHRVPGALNSFRQTEKGNRSLGPLKLDDCFFLMLISISKHRKEGPVRRFSQCQYHY